MVSVFICSTHNLRTWVLNIPAEATCHPAQARPVLEGLNRELERVVSSCANGLSRGWHRCGFVGSLLLLHGHFWQPGRVAFGHTIWLSWD